MKMMDMGMNEEERYGGMATASQKEMKNKKHYETIMMSSDKMPKEMGEMHAGEMHKMCVEMMVKSVSKEEGEKTEYKMELRRMGKMPKEQKEINPYKKSDED